MNGNLKIAKTVTLPDNIYEFAWSPDSTKLGCLCRRSLIAFRYVYDWSVCVVDVLSGTVERLRTPPFTSRGSGNVHWLPNGDLLYATNDLNTQAFLLYSHGRALPVPKFVFAQQGFSAGKQYLHGNAVYFQIDDKGVWMYNFSDWSDRNHSHFPAPFRRLIFQLMCVRHRLDPVVTKKSILWLPISMWLNIFAHLVECELHSSFLTQPKGILQRFMVMFGI
jgi:hypothetical protein